MLFTILPNFYLCFKLFIILVFVLYMSENKKGIKKSKDSFMTELSFLFSQDRSDQEGLYFPRRRVRIDDPSKARLLNRIENQDFKGTSEQEIFLIVNY